MSVASAAESIANSVKQALGMGAAEEAGCEASVGVGSQCNALEMISSFMSEEEPAEIPAQPSAEELLGLQGDEELAARQEQEEEQQPLAVENGSKEDSDDSCMVGLENDADFVPPCDQLVETL